MLKNVIKIGVGLALTGVGGFANAGELGFLGAAALQYKQLTMEQTFKGVSQAIPGGNEGDLSASLPVLSLQIISFYKSFYAVGKVELSIAEQNVESSVPFTRGNSALNTDVEREDYSIALGYKLNDVISIFGGFMAGKTTLLPDYCTGCNNLASIMQDDGFGEYQQAYEEMGFFGGVSTGWNVGPGRMGISVAYALMDGKYSDNYRDSYGTAEFDYEGDSKGLSAALSWTAPITTRLFYFVDARVQQYSMDAADQTGVAPFDNSSVETDETLYGLAGGVQMLF